MQDIECYELDKEWGDRYEKNRSIQLYHESGG